MLPHGYQIQLSSFWLLPNLILRSDSRGSPLALASADVLLRWLMEEWGFLDDRELDSFRGYRSCATCDHFGYVTLGQCQVLGSCHLRQGLLAPGAHSLKCCEHWVFCSAVEKYKEGI